MPINKASDYLRPDSPSRFYFDVYLDSIDRLLLQTPQILCYEHFGLTIEAQNMLKKHRKQLLIWKEVIADILKRSSFI